MKKRYTNTEVLIQGKAALWGMFLLCVPLLAFSQKQAQKAHVPAILADDEARPPHSELNKNQSEKGFSASRG